ncbi:MAG: cysteine rich repeat-containing protein [Deltaproteobacteria bacterium]|nr:cysteine rich repeat-containing protein [Deltaproteobacteria bacterium]
MILLLAGLLCLGWPFSTEAAGPNQGPCAEDAAKFCTSVESGGPAAMISLMECLEAHETELSPGCRDFETGMGGARMERSEVVGQKRAFRQNCMNDMVRLCQDAKPTQGGMIDCLKEHRDELSAPCGTSLNELK